MSRTTIALLAPILVAGLLLTSCNEVPISIPGVSSGAVRGVSDTVSGATTTFRATVENLDSRLEKAKAGLEKINEGKELMKQAVR